MKVNQYNVYNKDYYGNASACKAPKNHLYSRLINTSSVTKGKNSIIR
jgi:hypothetical protein